MSRSGIAAVNIHASCVAIGGKAVLLLGASASGKSDLALRLIDGGAVLVADDRTILRVKNGGLNASAPPSIRGLLEIRAVGIVKLPVRASAPMSSHTVASSAPKGFNVTTTSTQSPVTGSNLL